MEEAIKYNVSGIKCDADGCDFVDESARLEDYDQWLNRPCPECGGNLLTEEDLKATKAMSAMFDWLNVMLPKAPDDAKRVAMTLEMDGSGHVTPKIKEQPK